ncbi:MAG TPA: hypothetical protein VLG44_07955 [Chlamydiales bacterium]|nr:hypothetical protein [Chlamydiales bacterium]
MAVKAVSKPVAALSAAKQPVATATMSPAVEATAIKLCKDIAFYERKAAGSKTRTNHYKNFAQFSAQVQQFNKTYPTNSWAKLAKERFEFACKYTHPEQAKRTAAYEALDTLPTSFKKGDKTAISAGVKTAYVAVMFAKNADGIKRCVDAATRALSSLPKTDKDVADLTARIEVINYLNRHRVGGAFDQHRGEGEDGPIVHAPGCTYKAAQMASRVLSHPVGIAATVIAVNSVLHATGLMPAFLGFTRAFTVQGMAGIATDGISRLIGLFGSNDAAAQAINTAVQNAQGFANTAGNAANLAEAATTLEAAQAAAAQAATAAQSAASIATATPQAKVAADLAANASTRAAAAVAKLAGSGSSAFKWVAGLVGAGFVANSLAHACTEDRLPEWSRHFTAQGMFDLVRGLCNRGPHVRLPTPQPSPQPSPRHDGGHGGAGGHEPPAAVPVPIPVHEDGGAPAAAS